jgi:hypothetical protein
MRLLGLIILLLITDSTVDAVECRHHYCRERVGKKGWAITLFSIWSAMGEGRVNRDREVGGGREIKGNHSRSLLERLFRRAI